MSHSRSSLELPAEGPETWQEKAKTEIEQNKLVECAIGALAVGVIVASTAKLTGVVGRLFPTSDMLMAGSFVDSVEGVDKVEGAAIARRASELSRLAGLSAAGTDNFPGIEIAAARAAEIKRLTLLPTTDLNALRAARAAGEESGALVEGRIYLTSEFPQIIFKITREGAEAFLDGTAGNRFTDYLRGN
jgi:hypothetical protein